MPDSLKAAVDAQLRVIKHLPVGDLSLIVLKGHLLIEELLNVIVKSTAKHPEAIDEAHLNFYRLAQMAKAFHYEERLRPKLVSGEINVEHFETESTAQTA